MQQSGGLQKPCARRSIHNHDGFCPFAYPEVMSRYGILTGYGSSFQHDEVDNAMSNHLSKSLPATLLAYYSDDFSNDEMDKKNRSNRSNQSQNRTFESYHLPSHQLQHESANQSHNESYEFRSRSNRSNQSQNRTFESYHLPSHQLQHESANQSHNESYEFRSRSNRSNQSQNRTFESYHLPSHQLQHEPANQSHNESYEFRSRSNRSNQSQNRTFESYHLPSHQLQHESANQSHNESYEFRSRSNRSNQSQNRTFESYHLPSHQLQHESANQSHNESYEFRSRSNRSNQSQNRTFESYHLPSHQLQHEPANQSHNESYEFRSRSNRSNQSQNRTFESLHLPSHQLQYKSANQSHNESYEFRSTHRSPEPDTNHENGSISIVVKVAAFAAIVAAFIWFYFNQIPRVDKNKNYDETLFSIDLITLAEKYQISQDSILQVQSGIATIFDKEDTCFFIFVYNSKSRSSNKVHFENFIHDVASTAAKYLRNHSTNVHHIVLESKYLHMKSHSDLMNLYRQEVDETGVLDNMPSNLAMAFHYYCDEYNPMVKKSAIFFTLDLGKCTSSDTGQKTVSKTSHVVIESV